MATDELGRPDPGTLRLLAVRLGFLVAFGLPVAGCASRAPGGPTLHS
jgi:hypothetical protein